MPIARTRTVVFAGVVAVLGGGTAAAAGAWTSDVDLRRGLIPWSLAGLVAGVGLILWGSYWCGIGRPALLVRWGSRLAFVGLGCAAAFLCGTGILSVVGSVVLSAGDTPASSIGTLSASVFTLLVLPAGLLALGVAALADTRLPIGSRGLPLEGTLLFLVGPVLVALLPGSHERTVFVAWPVLLGSRWAAYGLVVARELGLRRHDREGDPSIGARSDGSASPVSCSRRGVLATRPA